MGPHDLQDEKDCDDIHRDFTKLKIKSEKTGLSEGLSDGRDQNFQQSFDVGYKSGFQNGLALGKLKGSLSVHFKEDPIGDELLKNPTSAWCQVCVDKDLINKSISEMQRIQTEVNNKNFGKLRSQYPDVIDH